MLAYGQISLQNIKVINKEKLALEKKYKKKE